MSIIEQFVALIALMYLGFGGTLFIFCIPEFGIHAYKKIFKAILWPIYLDSIFE